MMENINLAFVTDNAYYRQTFVSMNSVLNTCEKSLYLKIYFFDVGIHQDNIRELSMHIKNIPNAELHIINIDSKNINNFKTHTHVSSSAYAKIYLAQYIPEDYVIYLDGDIICLYDISKLWEKIDEKYSICAVHNPGYTYDNTIMGLPLEAKTFNSGVMLLNLKKIRDISAPQALLEATLKYNGKTRLHDQAIYNKVFYQDWKPLDYKWNLQKMMLNSTFSELEMEKRYYINLVKHPYMIHFTSNSKPWLFRCAHPYKKYYKQEYEKYFGKLKFKDISIKSLCQRILEFGKFQVSKIKNYIEH